MKRYQEIMLLVIAFVLAYILVFWGRTVHENFSPQKYSQTVNLPLTSTPPCTNSCGPTARCSITGTQCMADTDCAGCVPPTTHHSRNKKKKSSFPKGDDDSGKLTTATTPEYSTLTTDIGTFAGEFTTGKKPIVRVPKANFGFDTWKHKFVEESNLYQNTFGIKNAPFIPIYKKQQSLTGEFENIEPLPSNYT